LRVIEPGDIARGIAEGRMGGDVLDPLAVGIDLAASRRLSRVFLVGERPRRGRARAQEIFRLLPIHGVSCVLLRYAVSFCQKTAVIDWTLVREFGVDVQAIRRRL